MRKLTFSLLMFAALAALASPKRDWKPALVVAFAPHHGVTTSRYTLKSEGITYVLSTNIIGGCQPLLTVNGQTQIAVDGRNAWIHNDYGKDCKLAIAEKVAEVADASPR